MNETEPGTARVGAVVNHRLPRLLLRWWRGGSFEERYLADAVDHADLERRQRALERTTMGPAFVTFNH